MTRLALLVRGINVGGKNKVVMAIHSARIDGSRIRPSGNLHQQWQYLLYNGSFSRSQLVECLSTFFEKHYPFIQLFSLLSREDYEAECANLPQWWTEEMARKDVLFYTEGLDRNPVEKLLALKLGDEVFHFGRQRFSGANPQKKAILKPPTTNIWWRCLSIVRSLFATLTTLTKLVHYLRNKGDTQWHC